MADLIGALVGIAVALVMIPIVILIVLFSLAAAGIGIALSLAFTLLSIFLGLLFPLAPFILVGLIVYWMVKPSQKRIAAQ
jgi:uncharacterized membrane protein